MNMLRQILSAASSRTYNVQRAVGAYPLNGLRLNSSSTNTGGDKGKVLNNADIEIVDYEDPDYLPLPEYPIRPNEELGIRKQRLVYQSRKRGMLENDLLLSTFAAKYLKDFSAEQTAEYDKLINGVTNDWDIYYWATEVKPTPPEHDNEVMNLLKQHVKNSKREMRVRQPDL